MMQHRNNTFKILSILISILSIICAVCLYKYSNKNHRTLSNVLGNYDYIIVGGGTAGCVLASKLSENNSKSVLLIESGDYFNFIASVPLFAAMLQGSKYDWSFKSQPQQFSSFGLHNQSQSLPRGKGLGGSNQINFMLHGEDIMHDLEKWKSFGIEGWEYKKLQSYIQKITGNNSSACLTNEESCTISNDVYSTEHNLLHSSYSLLDTKSKLNDILSRAVRELKCDDMMFNSAKSTIDHGQRWTSYHSHLKPVLDRKNLHILLNAQVTKVIFHNKQAVGVEIINENNRKRKIYCQSDVILSAGAFHTPQILLLSGIGPEYLLKKYHIKIVVDLPGVGRNLHDHLNMPLYVSITKPISVTTDKVLQMSEFWNYIVHRKGVLSESPVSGFVRKSDIGVMLFGMGSTDERLMRSIANYKLETFESLFPFHNNSSQEGFVLLATCLKPLSRGYVTVKDSRTHNLPIVNPQYLSKYKDVECMIRAVSLAEELMNTTEFRNIGVEIQWPKFHNCINSDRTEYLECIIRTSALTGHHPGGSCRMGDIENRHTVVDNSLRVKGTTGLRIMDASILPEPLSTFPNSVLMAMAAHATEIITNKIMYGQYVNKTTHIKN
ncbi:ninaG [Carabus blaptoides fortunei]